MDITRLDIDRKRSEAEERQAKLDAKRVKNDDDRLSLSIRSFGQEKNIIQVLELINKPTEKISYFPN
jgi:hypothetical protein